MDGTTPVSGSSVEMQIQDGGTSYQRQTTSGADGRFTIDNARPGEYTLTYSASGAHVPVSALPGGNGYNDAVCYGADSFTVAAGATVTRPNYWFQPGGYVYGVAIEAFMGNTYNIPGIGVTLTSVADTGKVYYWSTGDDGWGRAYMPPGSYTMVYSDPLGMYGDVSIGTIGVTSGVDTYRNGDMVPNAGTHAIYGRVTEAGSSPVLGVHSYVDALKTNPDAGAWPEPFRRVMSQGDGRYLVRVPDDTGFAGNAMTLRYDDLEEAHPHVSQTWTSPLNLTVATLHDVSTPIGGSISGTVHDSDGLPVEGVMVGAASVQWSPYLGDSSWEGGNNWWTRTGPDGVYTIYGLPAGTDYKVNFSAYYDVGMPLPIKYADYYRRTYKNRPLLDSLNTSATPIVVDHTPVTVFMGLDTPSIDETISLGGYVALHADGPSAPTGAVYCDVLYNVGPGKWVEIDSGYTTGGTFQKLWKVLPVGHYRLDYRDYFGRGSGSWEFDLGEGEKKYTSVVVPTPLTSSTPALIGASFAGLIGGGQGLELGGTGGLTIDVDAWPSLPTTAPPPPPGLLLYANSTFNFVPSGAAASGMWTLTMPYDPKIPDPLVPNIRVWHVKKDGTGELLKPIAWSTAHHTVQVQTSSLSPFQVVYRKVAVVLGTPMTSGTLNAYKTFTAYGTIVPKHTAGAHSVQVKAYVYSSRSHKWVVYKTFTATNRDYSGGTRYYASVKLKRGTYRLYAYAPADAWHLHTHGPYRKVTVK
jgi:hypothetical protein